MRTAASLVCILLAASSTACDGSVEPRRPNVLLICLDTVRADHLGCYGYAQRDTTPRLDALADEGIQFLDASATAGWTKPSVPSFLTGTYPVQHGVYEGSARDVAGEVSHALPQAATTLAEVFEGQGFATAAFVRNAQLRAGLGFEQGFDLYQDEAGDAREIRWRAQDWLEARPQGRPFFLYLHLLDAHWPWPVPDEYAARYAPLEQVELQRDRQSGALRDAINAGERGLTPQEREAMVALYDGSLRYVDDQLAQLFAWLQRRDLWQDTIVCVVSDHGEEFGEHGKVGHGHGLHEGLLRVPWILRVPGSEPRRVTRPVSLVDLFPTLVAAAGIEPPVSSEGVDRLAQPDLARPILAEHKEPRAYQQSLRSGARKLVRRFKPLDAGDGTPRPVPGRRYDVDVVRGADGRLRAAKVQESEDDPDDPLEIKGPIDRLDGERFELFGLAVRLAPDAQLYGEVPEGSGPDVLAEGVLVKVVVEATADAFVAHRVKVYAPDAGTDLELRGDLGSFVGEVSAGLITLAGLELVLDADTRWKGVDDPDADLTREELLEWLLAGGFAAQENGVERRGFDLASDPAELATTGEGASDLDRALDALVAELVLRRFWSADDQQRLDASQLDELRALGYAR